MLSISNPISGPAALKYYLEFSAADYYVERAERAGRYFGEGAKLLGAKGIVSPSDLKNLFDGFSPDRKKALVQNAGAANRQAAYDLTFSAPKSVSVMWALSSPAIQRKIAAIHLLAIKRALRYLERVAGQTRRGHAGAEIERARVAFAVFLHSSSRDFDPALHGHCLLLNLGVRDDGSIGALRTNEFFSHKMAAGAVYRAELAALLTRKLGLVVERDQSSFKLEGFSQALCDRFSKRRKAIEAILERNGVYNAEAAKLAALASRPKKVHVPISELRKAWKEEANALKWTTEEAEKLLHRKRAVKNVISLRDALVSEAIGEFARKEGYFTERDLVRWVAQEAQGRGIDGKQAIDGVRHGLTLAGIVQLSAGRDRQMRYTTQSMLDVEQRLLGMVEASRKSVRHVITVREVERALEKESRRRSRLKLPSLSKEQLDAIRHIATRPGSIQAVVGGAGTGKSSMFQAGARIFKKHGLRVVGVALSGKAAQELQANSGIKSTTIASALLDIKSGPFGLSRGRKKLAPHAPKISPLHGVTLPVLRFRSKPMRLNSKTVVIVDEASMVDTLQMEALLKTATKAKAKVVLVGDPRQLQSIEAGGSFKAITEKIGTTSLTENFRQKEPWAKEIVSLFSQGQAQQALEIVKAKELLHCSKTLGEAKAMLIDHWRHQGVEKPQKNLILAGTNTDVNELNALAQAERTKGRKLAWVGVKINGQKIYKGDRVLFERNDRSLGVANGSLGTVLRVDKAVLVARLDDGRTVDIPLKYYDQIKLGYAVTSHKAQGMTTKNAYVLIDQSTQHREITHVQASRATALTRFYVDETTAGEGLKKLPEMMSWSREKVMASSFLTPQDSQPSQDSTTKRKRQRRAKQQQKRSEQQRSEQPSRKETQTQSQSR